MIGSPKRVDRQRSKVQKEKGGNKERQWRHDAIHPKYLFLTWCASSPDSIHPFSIGTGPYRFRSVARVHLALYSGLESRFFFFSLLLCQVKVWSGPPEPNWDGAGIDHSPNQHGPTPRTRRCSVWRAFQSWSLEWSLEWSGVVWRESNSIEPGRIGYPLSPPDK